MRKPSIQLDPSVEVLDPHWVAVPLAVVLGALVAVLAWPVDHMTSKDATATIAESATPHAAEPMPLVNGPVADTAQEPEPELTTSEDNHAATF